MPFYADGEGTARAALPRPTRSRSAAKLVRGPVFYHGGGRRGPIQSIHPDALTEMNPMCGRFTLFAPTEQVAETFTVPVPELFPRYNIAPSQPVAVVRAAPGRRQLLVCKWGLVPGWSRDGKGFINARAETAHDKPAFRSAFRKRRCLVPADGWYEWKAEGRRKQPYLFGPTDGRPLAFAGLWEAGRAGLALDTCAILTTGANELAAPVHDRMPTSPHYGRGTASRSCWPSWRRRRRPHQRGR
jgi:putative SOS response-associated peptidase YedK